MENYGFNPGMNQMNMMNNGYSNIPLQMNQMINEAWGQRSTLSDSQLYNTMQQRPLNSLSNSSKDVGLK